VRPPSKGSGTAGKEAQILLSSLYFFSFYSLLSLCFIPHFSHHPRILFHLRLEKRIVANNLSAIMAAEQSSTAKRDIKNHLLFEIATEVANRGWTMFF
jgi:hypothetical protein